MSGASRPEVKGLMADQVSMASAHLLKHLRGRLRNPCVLVRKDGVVIRGTTGPIMSNSLLSMRSGNTCRCRSQPMRSSLTART